MRQVGAAALAASLVMAGALSAWPVAAGTAAKWGADLGAAPALASGPTVHSAPPADAATITTIPASCQGRLSLPEGYEACLADAEPGTGIAIAAAVQLGTWYGLGGEVEEAARLFDLADPPGDDRRLEGTVLYHAVRADTYRQLGRLADGVEDARRVIAVLMGEEEEAADAVGPATGEPPEALLALVLPVLRASDDPLYRDGIALLESLPTDMDDLVQVAGRATVYQQLEEYPLALPWTRRAFELAPEHSALANNYCYLLVLLDRADQALPVCDMAVADRPDMAPFHHSRAAALAALGRCEEAGAALDTARTLAPSDRTFATALPCERSWNVAAGSSR